MTTVTDRTCHRSQHSRTVGEALDGRETELAGDRIETAEDIAARWATDPRRAGVTGGTPPRTSWRCAARSRWTTPSPTWAQRLWRDLHTLPWLPALGP